MRKAAFAIVFLCLTSLATAQVRTIGTTFMSNNGGSTGWVNMFDINNLTTAGLTVTSLDVNISSAVNTAFTIDVYTTTLATTYVGNDGNAAAWTKVASGAGMGQGRDMPTPVDISDFVLQTGSQGLAIHYTGASMAYTNGNGNNQKYSNSELQLDLGLVRAGFFTGTTFTPRVWNGNIHYSGGFTCNATSNLSIGTSGSVDLNGGPATDFFQMAASLGNTNTINLGKCSLKLDTDGVFNYSVQFGAPFFNGYGGTLVRGAASGKFSPPNMPVLIGVAVYHAGVSYNRSGPTACTNTVKTTLAR